MIPPEPPKDIEGLADSGSGVPFCSGIGLFPDDLIVDAPFPLHVTGADKNTIHGGQKGVWVNVVLPAHSSNGPQLFRCKHVFVYILDIGSKFIIGFPFLLRFGFALIPVLPYLVPKDCIKLRPWTRPLRTVVQCHQCQPEQECRVQCVACNYLKHCPRHGAQPIVCLQAMDKHNKMGLLYGCLKPTSAHPWQTDPVRKVTWNGRMLIHDIGSHFGTYHDTALGPDTVYKTHGSFYKSLRVQRCHVALPEPSGEERCPRIAGTVHDPYEFEPGIQAHFTTNEYSVALSGLMPGFAQPDPPLMVKLLSEHARLPRRGTPGSAGPDLFAAAEVVVAPKERVKVPTDLAMAIPTGLYGQLASRSSLALKYWLDVAGGVIDNDYRDHIQIIIANESSTEYRMVPGDIPVAQLLLNRYAVCDVVQTDSLDETDRKGGFGSTDVVSMADKNETAPGDAPRRTLGSVRTEACRAGYLLRVQEERAWQDLLLSYSQWFSDMQVNQRAVRISHSTAGRSSAQLEFEAVLHSVTCRMLCIVAFSAHHYQSVLRGLGHLSTCVMLQCFAISSGVLGRIIAKPSLFLGLRATGIPRELPVRLEHMVDHSLDIVLGQANPADETTVEVLDATLLALGLRYPEQCREVNNELGQLSGRNHRKDSDDTAWWETNSEADSEGMSSEAVTDDECVGNSTNRYKPPCAPDHFMGGWGYSRAEQANLASSPPVAVTDPSSLMSIVADILKSSSPAKPVQCGATSSVKRLQAKVRHKPKWHAFASVARRGDLCLRPNVVQLVRDWCSEREIHIDVDVFSKHPPLALARKTFSRALKGPLYKEWVGSTLWVLPPTGMYQRGVQKIIGEGCKGFMLLPTRKQHEWWWMMGEITIDGVDIPPTSEIFQTKDGKPLCTAPGEQYRLVYFDAVGQEQADIDLHEEEDQQFGVGVPVHETPTLSILTVTLKTFPVETNIKIGNPLVPSQSTRLWRTFRHRERKGLVRGVIKCVILFTAGQLGQ